jgi:predicted metal-dependent phosphoesterase TrpH
VKRFLLLTAAVAAAVFLFVALTLPPRRLAIAPAADGTAAGMLHVHTNRSDGLGSPDEIAAAAARAGLTFVVFTDHGDATRTPDPPAYRSGVLCLDGVEISTTGGHYVAIDMPPSPYPLGGEARDVVEDVRRLGGFGIAAHPDSPKLQLRWTGWDAPFDGIELINPDTGWRLLAAQPGAASKRRLLAALLDYPFRAPEVMASLIQPTAVLTEWEAVARTRRLVTIAGADAHAKLAPRNGDPGDTRLALPFPGYEQSFRMMSVHVSLGRPLTGNAAADGAAVMRAIRNGHLYTAIDGIATPPSFEFTASNALGTVAAGDVIGLGGPLALHVRSNAPEGFTTIVHEGTSALSSVGGTKDLTVHAPEKAGVYWAEILAPPGLGGTTWIRSNPIYVRGPAPPDLPQPDTRTVAQGIFDGNGAAGGWRIEHDANSVGAVDIAGAGGAAELRYRFGLAGGPAIGQFTSLAYDLPSGAGDANAVSFTIRAERAMRVSLQLRDSAADRWQRSIYVDASARERTVTLDDFLPVGVTRVARPARDTLRAIMFVVDTTNTRPGTSGRIWIRNAALMR